MMRLVLNQPLTLPSAQGSSVSAIFWVRIYCDGHSAVVIVANVPANPGPGPDHKDIEIAQHVKNYYLSGVQKIRWFMCEPGRCRPHEPEQTRYFEAGFKEPKMTRVFPPGYDNVERSEISALIGRPLDLLPPMKKFSSGYLP
jgi:hypothetical protein